MKPVKFGIGQAVRRVEDQRLVSGHGHYTADDIPEGALQAVFLRSSYANAKFTIGDLKAAKAMPGVKAIYTADDFKEFADLPCMAPMQNTDGTKMPLPPYPLLARGEVRHVGDAIALIVAQTADEARLAAEAIEIDYQGGPVVVDMKKAIAAGAPLVWPQFKSNVAVDTSMGDKSAVDAIFAKAEHVVELEVVNNRLVSNYMEPRAAIAAYDATTKRYTFTLGTQGVHNQRGLIATVMKIDPKDLHVITRDVGGGFGTKGFVFREYPLLLSAAKRLGQTVAWVSDRTEHFMADAQGRDNVTVASMALDRSGRFLAMKVDILGNMGAYLSQFAPYIPWLGATMATGVYDIPALHARMRAVYTHTVPVDAYRGAGRPEAAYVLERLVDLCASRLKMPREEIRARNFIKPSQMPFKTSTGRTYDVGEFEAIMRHSLAKADYAGFATRRNEAKAKGMLRGIGFSSYIECTAWGSNEEGSVRLEDDGTFTVLIGTQSNGQGHETAYAQVVAQHLDVPVEQVRVVQGDSDRVLTGNGTGGSRSIPVGAVMVDRASTKLAQKLKELAADKLEAAIADLEIVDGHVRIAGTDRAMSYGEIAKLPAATPDKRIAMDEFMPPEATYPNGTHVAEVEVDPQTGVAQVVSYSICDDFGMTLNPLLLAGQVHGGVAQGIGQALMERTVYSEDGQLLTASFMDYCMPRANNIPSFRFETRNVPSTTNPLGLKGAGEAGSIASCPAVMNALVDALQEFGVEHIDMPATPPKVFAAMHAKQA